MAVMKLYNMATKIKNGESFLVRINREDRDIETSAAQVRWLHAFVTMLGGKGFPAPDIAATADLDVRSRGLVVHNSDGCLLWGTSMDSNVCYHFDDLLIPYKDGAYSLNIN